MQLLNPMLVKLYYTRKHGWKRIPVAYFCYFGTYALCKCIICYIKYIFKKLWSHSSSKNGYKEKKLSNCLIKTKISCLSGLVSHSHLSEYRFHKSLATEFRNIHDFFIVEVSVKNWSYIDYLWGWDDDANMILLSIKFNPSWPEVKTTKNQDGCIIHIYSKQ